MHDMRRVQGSVAMPFTGSTENCRYASLVTDCWLQMAGYMLSHSYPVTVTTIFFVDNPVMVRLRSKLLE